ncbi:MAG TPA: hypothetical protein VJP81_02525 [Candidatus Dormibacteraeota bacterium]|nr:hypothetical protein [Candidatus Dormibacteraeota bacterium]
MDRPRGPAGRDRDDFYIARAYYLARDAINGSDDVLAQRLSATRPMLAVWVGAIGPLMLLVLMVFKPF